MTRKIPMPLNPDMIDAIKADRKAGTDGPWVALNMTNADSGGPMTAEDMGEYVKNSFKLGTPERFLFVKGEGFDVCLVGNGPKGPNNARRIARLPDLEAAFLEQDARLNAAVLEERERCAMIADKMSEKYTADKTDQNATSINDAMLKQGEHTSDAIAKAIRKEPKEDTK